MIRLTGKRVVITEMSTCANLMNQNIFNILQSYHLKSLSTSVVIREAHSDRHHRSDRCCLPTARLKGARRLKVLVTVEKLAHLETQLS